MDEESKDKFIRLDKCVGERIKSIRVENRLSQSEYGEKLGKSLPTINRVERGHRAPDAEMIVGLKEVFGADILWVLTGRADPDMEKGTSRVPLLRELPEDLSSVSPDKIDSHIRLPRLPDHAWAIRIYGEDMVPTVRSGDYVVFLPMEPGEGDLALYRFEGGEPRVRRLSTKGGALNAEAPDCPPIPAGQVKIVGRVVQVVRHIELAGGK